MSSLLRDIFWLHIDGAICKKLCAAAKVYGGSSHDWPKDTLLLVLPSPRLATPLRPKPSSNEACGWFRTKLSYMYNTPPSRRDVASGRRPSGVGRSCDPAMTICSLVH